MNTSTFRTTCAVVMLALATLSPSFAQQRTTAPQQAPVQQVPVQQAPVSSQPAAPAPMAAAPQMPAAPVQAAPVPATSAAMQSAPATPDVVALASDAGRTPKSTVTALRELSPWSMFMSADIVVKAVMIGLAFASLVTWTVFIAKMIELSLVRRTLGTALRKIGDARSLAEAQFALGAKDSVLSALLAAAMSEARLSAGVSREEGIQER